MTLAQDLKLEKAVWKDIEVGDILLDENNLFCKGNETLFLVTDIRMFKTGVPFGKIFANGGGASEVKIIPYSDDYFIWRKASQTFGAGEGTEEIDRVAKAACKAHLDRNQKYGDYLPYTFHLRAVVENLPSNASADLVMAAWLHDAIEDAGMTYNDVLTLTGSTVCAEIVYAVTNEMGRNRKERHDKTYPKIRANQDAITLKLADRYANTEFSKATGHRMFGVYVSELPEFLKALGLDTLYPGMLTPEIHHMVNELKVLCYSEGV